MHSTVLTSQSDSASMKNSEAHLMTLTSRSDTHITFSGLVFVIEITSFIKINLSIGLALKCLYLPMVNISMMRRCDGDSECLMLIRDLYY